MPKGLVGVEDDPLLLNNILSEVAGGATNVAGALSNGRLSAGISPWGELVFLRWPSLTYSDQLRYFTRHMLDSWRGVLRYGLTPLASKLGTARMEDDAPSAEYRRHGRPYELYPGLGSRGGLWTPGTGLVWAEDPRWRTDRADVPEDSPFLRTRLEGAPGGLALEVTDWIDAQADLLVREFEARCDEGRFVYHATFAPWTGRHDRLIPSSYDPPDAGFAAAYLREEDAVLHFQPRQRRPLPATAPLTAAAVDTAYPEGGTFVAWGFLEGAEQLQIGADLAGSRGAPRERAPTGGRKDAEDGQLDGCDRHLGRVDAALLRKLPRGGGRVTVLISLGPTAEQAVRPIRDARREGLGQARERTARRCAELAARIRLPDALGARARRVARRSVLTTLAAQDAASGAIVASLSRQPPYHFDWGRDGAFFDLALDLCGFPERVDAHHELYRRTQLREGHAWLLRAGRVRVPLAGHWRANQAADGGRGFWPTPFEIDETALTVWNLWRHERALPSAQREAYRQRMGPTLERAAEALLGYVDLRAGWIRPAYEDDRLMPSATLHGVTSILTALAAAADTGPAWGIDAAKQAAWGAAARRLREGALHRLEKGLSPTLSGWRGAHWALWPCPLFREPDHPVLLALQERLTREISSKLRGERAGFAYLGEQLFTLALSPGRRPEHEAMLKDGLRVLTEELPLPGSDHFGEIALRIETAEGPRYQNRTAIPQVWTSILVALAAWAVLEPTRFTGLAPVVGA